MSVCNEASIAADTAAIEGAIEERGYLSTTRWEVGKFRSPAFYVFCGELRSVQRKQSCKTDDKQACGDHAEVNRDPQHITASRGSHYGKDGCHSGCYL